MIRSLRSCLVFALLVTIAGCAGYRGGWQSVAYVGDPPVVPERPARSRYEPPVISLPGVRLQARIDNESQTYDTAIYFGLPLSIDPRTTYPRNVQPGRTRVFVTATPADASFVFRPGEAQLSVAGQTFNGSAGYEFAMWTADWQRVESGGNWQHRPVGDAFALAETGRTYHLSVDFDTPVPSPGSPDIAIDLSKALASTVHPALPVIRFEPMRWKEGYQ
jgi:hypothetical protein